MNYYVYIIITFHKNKYYTYAGYTNNVKKRLFLHNNSKGAKFTRGRKWNLIYIKKFKTKKIAIKYEIKLKKDRILRNKIKNEYLKKNENINTTSL